MLNSYLLRALSGGDESMAGPFGNKIPKAYMSPDQLKTMNEESSKLTNSKLDPSKMVTGAGALSHVLDVIRGQLMRQNAFQAMAGQGFSAGTNITGLGSSTNPGSFGAPAPTNQPPAGSNIPPMPQGIPGISVGQNEDKSLAAFLAGLA